MRPCPALFALALASGCAAGEPIGEPVDALQLGVAADPDGRPILADAVWISVAADEDRAPARCMEPACDTWIAAVVTDDEVTAYAQVCGFLYLEPLSMAGASAVHVTVTADATPCAPERVPPS
jgi:hypothetical protein